MWNNSISTHNHKSKLILIILENVVFGLAVSEEQTNWQKLLGGGLSGLNDKPEKTWYGKNVNSHRIINN